MSKAFDITIRPKKSVPKPVKSSINHHSNGLLFLGIIFIIILVILDFSSNNPKSEISSDIVNNPQVESENTKTPDTTAATTQNQNSSNNNPTQKAVDTTNNVDNNSAATDTTKNIQPAESIDKSKITIRILNGARIPNAANNTKKLLEKQGFSVEKVGDAKNLYQHTIIYFNKDKKNEAVLVQLALDNQNISIKESNSLTVNSDILIVVGLK